VGEKPNDFFDTCAMCRKGRSDELLFEKMEELFSSLLSLSSSFFFLFDYRKNIKAA